ncbi:hypothetical protein AWZ03_003737 [Drosophila navojoa]|uniref:Uncharacterized protein n=1 Tax=Drosophila navojoa TaxID=7232 RepID=A0A484BLP2_DRONA|nr:uncharacterized protein LOC108649635 [Drosophila navojoa]TDG49749.1 hypothetical protein AWZ03_003737 [Drosophila navojoa]
MASKKKTMLWEPHYDSSLMKTTTQIMMEEGSRPQRTLCTTDHKLVNFQSFNMEDPRYGPVDQEEELVQPMKSGYMREYTQPYPSRCKPLKPKGETPDFMWNRLPKNDFDPITGTYYKFLDDHMHNIPEVRKKVNFFRQLRNQSFLLY